MNTLLRILAIPLRLFLLLIQLLMYILLSIAGFINDKTKDINDYMVKHKI